MTIGLFGNGDGSGSIKVGGTDAIQISTSQNVTIPQNLTVAGTTTFTGIANFSSGFTGVTTSAIQPIAATVASNAMTITLNPTTLTFRSPTANSGTVYTRTISTPLTITMPTGASIGAVANQLTRYVVICIDNSGSLELAVSNVAGGVQLDETNFLSTTIISAASTAQATVYSSTTAITSMPYRVVGVVECTQATAGTFATAPSLVQGTGGQAIDTFGSLGQSQVWTFVTRVSGTTYYNTTNRPIVGNYITSGSGTSTSITANINGASFIIGQCALPSGIAVAAGSVIIPPGASYIITVSSGTLTTAYELR